jgi:ADP-ribose pyrophosphatase YjhB (NUDIX family)
MAVSAGCLIWGNRGALLVRDWSGGWALPGGSVAVGESALCGAEREAFEETGLRVRATELAIVLDNGFHLYWCDAAPDARPRVHRPLEIREAAWLNPGALSPDAWRYPGQGEIITGLVVATSQAIHEE